MAGRFWVAVALGAALGLSGCSEKGAPEARKKIRTEHTARVASILREDIDRHAVGLRHAADRIAAGFVKVQGEQQERHQHHGRHCDRGLTPASPPAPDRPQHERPQGPEEPDGRTRVVVE